MAGAVIKNVRVPRVKKCRQALLKDTYQERKEVKNFLILVHP
jgi:hypothetical protein